MSHFNFFSSKQDGNKQTEAKSSTSLHFTSSNQPQLGDPAQRQITSQDKSSPQVNLYKYRDSLFSQQQKSPSYIFEAGQTWTGSDSSKKGVNPFSVSSESTRNSRTFKFREFTQKQNQNTQIQQQQQQQQFPNQPVDRNISSEQATRPDLQNPLSERGQLQYNKTQQDFRSSNKKLQFSPQVGQSNLYYQYINPIQFGQREQQNGTNMSDTKLSQPKKGMLSTTTDIIPKQGSGQSQISIRKNEFSTPNNRINAASTSKNIQTMPIINGLNGNFATERMQMLIPSNEKEALNGRYNTNSQQKRFSIQETQNLYAFSLPKGSTISMNSLTQIPQQSPQQNLISIKNESRQQNGQQQIRMQQQIKEPSAITDKGIRDQNNTTSSQMQNNSSNLTFSIVSPTKDINNLTQSQFHQVPKHINLSKTFSSPFLKKVHQIKKQQLAEVANGGRSPQSNSQLASRTLTVFPSTQIATPSNLKNLISASNTQQLLLNLENIKSREKSSSSDSNSCKSLFESPLSPPPKTKLMMEMSKYKKEQKDQNAALKSNRKSQVQQKTGNGFFRLKRTDNFDTQASESKITNSALINSQPNQQQQQFSFSPNKTLTLIGASQFKETLDKKNSNDQANLTRRSIEDDIEKNDEFQQGSQQNQQKLEDQQEWEFVPDTANESNYKNLQQIYHNSYKNIENILEENKYFQSINRIEEDMLSVTMKNKALLPRKLGILSVRPQTDSPQGPHSARLFKGTLNQIFEDTKDEQVATLTNLDSRKETQRLHTPQAGGTQSFTNIGYSTQTGYFKNNKQQSKIKDDLQMMKPPNSTTFLNFDIIKGDKMKQKLNLSYQNIANNYAEMISKALNHNDLSNLHTINLSNNHLSGTAVLTITRNLPDSISSIDLSNNSIGADGTRGLIPLFDSKRYYQLRKLNIENNNITDNGLKVIIPSIFSNMSIYVLNISHNKLSDQSCDFIKKLLQRSSYLQELYLHWNKISSKGGILIAQGLSENLNIKVLDLSHNGLGAIPKLKCGQKIIQSCSVLESAVKHLDISYNQFTHQECLDISGALLLNNGLYGIHLEGNESQALVDPRGFVFFPEKQNQKFEENHKNDIQIVTQRINSVNTKGPLKLQSFDCKALDNCWICHGWTEIRFEMKESSSDVFTGEPVFLHLDFEDYQPIYMDKDPEDPTKFVLNRMCPPNRKITFFFSDPCKNVIYFSKDYKFQEFQIPEGINLVFSDIVHHTHDKVVEPAPQDENNKNQSNKKGKKDDKKDKKDDKKDKKDDKKEKKGQNDKKDKQGKKDKEETSNKNQKKKPELTLKVATSPNSKDHPNLDYNEIKSPEEMKKEIEQEEITEALDEVSKNIKKTFKVKYLDGTVIEYHAPTYVNYLETEVSREIISKKRDYESNVKAKPRQPETYFRITKTDLWHRGVSLFRDYIPDSDALDKRCFEFDWQTSKLPKLLEKGKDIDDCKKILQSLYSLLRIAYKYLSCTGIANDVFCITQNPFSNFIQKAGIVDNNLLFIRDIDFNFISASNIALKPKTYRNPDKALVRNEFLEVMGRIALDKYIRNEKAKVNSEAMKMFFYEEGLLNHLYEFDSPQEWRRTRYWNQECDEKLKAQLPFIKNLYNTFCDSRKNEKRYFTTIKSMSLQEFKDMVYKYDLLDDLLVERDIIISFNLAMMTQVDELNSDRHFQMSFVEFLEALSRLAEKKSMVPLGELVEEYEVHERIVIQLAYKIESMLAYMKKKFESFSLKENQQGQSQVAQQNQQQQQNFTQQQQNVLQGVVSLFKRKSLLQNNTPTNNQSQRQINNKMQDESINFIKKLTMKKNTTVFDEKVEQDKLNLKNIIHKIMNKEKKSSNVNSPTKSPGKSPKKQLAQELELLKQKSIKEEKK